MLSRGTGRRSESIRICRTNHEDRPSNDAVKLKVKMGIVPGETVQVKWIQTGEISNLDGTEVRLFWNIFWFINNFMF